METIVQGAGSMIKGNVFAYPRDRNMTPDDLHGFINANIELSKNYNKLYRYYLGHHDILDEFRKTKRPDHKLVPNYAKALTETFNGYFMGVPPKISLNHDTDNIKLQDWLNWNSFQDKLNETSKIVDIMGRAYIFLYQNEDSQTCSAVSEPTNSFIIYDDTVAHLPIAYVRYTFDDNNNLSGSYYTQSKAYTIDTAYRLLDERINPIQAVPGIEFYANEERHGLFEPVMTLIDAFDKALSEKANNVSYFDSAYLLLLGLQFPHDEKTGEPIVNIDGNDMIVAEDADATQARVEFLNKPDSDGMQEHYLDRLNDLIYQVSNVANLKDDTFSGNSSGVAIQYKLLPMLNLASTKERKFTQSLRKLFGHVFDIGTVVNANVQDLTFKFIRNMPVNLEDEADTAQKLNGIVSKETQLKNLSFVDDAKQEIERIKDEQSEQVKQARVDYGAATDKELRGNGQAE